MPLEDNDKYHQQILLSKQSAVRKQKSTKLILTSWDIAEQGILHYDWPREFSATT